MNLRIIVLLNFIFLFSNLDVFSQKSVKIFKTDNPPVLDGSLNDDCWQNAAIATDFQQREPNEGQPMTDKTIVYICYDANNLYFGVKCFQDPSTIYGQEMLRDGTVSNDDRFAIMLDTTNDRRNAYFFGIAALGAMEDAIVNRDDGFGRSWNGIWNAKTTRTNESWDIEFVIPFKTISFDGKSDHFGLLMNRFITKKREWGTWPVGNVNSNQFQISDAGIMEGLEGITQGIGLDVSPYLLTGLDARRDEDTKYKLNAGGEIYYQVTPSLKASVTINTDFAETEADPRQINLTRYSLRLDEKRRFFLEGRNYFGFGFEAPSGITTPFFSRTIGLSSDGTPISVNYGAKVTGQISNWNIGMLYISDERDYGNSHFTVGRVKYNLGNLSAKFGDQSAIGVISTFGNSLSSDQNNLTGLDLKLASSKFRGNKNIALILYGLKSTTENVKGKDASWGAAFQYPNDFLNFSLGHVEIGENFIAGMGYVPRTNIQETYGSITVGPRLNGKVIRQLTFGGDFDYVTDFSGKLQNQSLNISPIGIRFESGERFNYSLAHKYDFLENDFNIYSTFIIPADEYKWWEHKVSLTTEGSRNLSGGVTYTFGDFYNGSQNVTTLTAKWKAMVHLALGGTYTTNRIELPGGSFTADIYEFNMNFLFNPNLTLFNYFQYDSQSEKIGWQSRFQWIIKPGNEILLAWNSGYTKPLERYSINEGALRFKVKYNFRF